MRNADYPEPFRVLVRELRRLPGVGPRSAERMALWLLEENGRPTLLGAALTAARDGVKRCRDCGFFSGEEVCIVCSDSEREAILCVVERATDILPIERSGAFRGHYHVLGGRLAPLEHVGPEDLRLSELTARLSAREYREVILALSTDVEGEATANYLVELLTPRGVAVSRLAQGMPAGGGLENADELTLSRALHGRRQAGDR
ncbi:MAG: recombination mediator RecR [Chthoniobacterales bacterium]